MDDRDLLEVLEPTVVTLLERHLRQTKDWYPHEYVPWGRGRDFVPGEKWDPEEFPLPDAVRSALFVNLLTEDNLPYYFNTIDRVFGNGAWGEWTRRWTSEEMRHSMVIRDYLTVTRALDPVELEDGRMQQVTGGQVPEPETVPDALVYVTLQEMATRISHRNTGLHLGDSAGSRMMKRIAADENLHHLFYRDLASKALETDPSRMVLAMKKQVCEFQMPGTGIPGFAAHAAAIARQNIYNFTHHYEQILLPIVLTHWKLERLEGLSDVAEKAREAIVKQIARIGRAARRLAERMEERQSAVHEGLAPSPL